MKAWPMKPWMAIVLSIAVSILLYLFVSSSPYIFGVGITLGVYLADVSSMKSGAMYGAVIALPLSLYLIANNIFHDNPAGGAFYSSLNVIMLIVFGAVYGAALVWVKNKIASGTRFG